MPKAPRIAAQKIRPLSRDSVCTGNPNKIRAAGIFKMPTLQTTIRYISKIPFVTIASKTAVGNEVIAAGSQKGGLNDKAKGYRSIVAAK